ncbi:MAG: hypothetical protein HRT44_11480, partial [Bdellovibrionales bacterium]|nr:hypothetical protein [Bdellovibrionales bacterium]NQZ19863.1 hypothetical protein [Bdellovibrionales bacterium]
QDTSSVVFSPKPISIEGHMCRVKEFTLSYKLQGKKVTFLQKWDYKTLETDRLKSLIEKVVKCELSKGFFEESQYCFAELMDNGDWWIHLKNKRNQFCYLKASNDGKNIEVIKRLYAKNSQCF